MSDSTHVPDLPDGHFNPLLSEDLRQLGEAVDNLNADTSYVLRALTETLRALRPVSIDGSVTAQHYRYLVESGAFTAEELDAAAKAVDRGALQLRIAEAWLSQLYASLSLEDATGYLGWSEETVQAAVSEGHLYAVEIHGKLRIPAWQLNVGSPSKLIPGLTELIEAVNPRWGSINIAGFMATPQSSLVAEGRKAPVEWLRDGGDVAAVISVVESNDWR